VFPTIEFLLSTPETAVLRRLEGSLLFSNFVPTTIVRSDTQHLKLLVSFPIPQFVMKQALKDMRSVYTHILTTFSVKTSRQLAQVLTVFPKECAVHLERMSEPLLASAVDNALFRFTAMQQITSLPKMHSARQV
jgi:hypothetical protein